MLISGELVGHCDIAAVSLTLGPEGDELRSIVLLSFEASQALGQERDPLLVVTSLDQHRATHTHRCAAIGEGRQRLPRELIGERLEGRIAGQDRAPRGVDVDPGQVIRCHHLLRWKTISVGEIALNNDASLFDLRQRIQ